MKRALVLSGGGAKGAFQFGAIKYIEEVLKQKDPGYKFDVIAGVSVGSLNGVMLAMDKYHELTNLWATISNDGVYTGSLGMLHALWQVLWNRQSVLGNGPLQKKLKNYIRLADIKSDKYDFRFGVVSLVTGKYQFLSSSQFSDDDNFRKAILASTTMPVIWTPVERIKLKEGTLIEDYRDNIQLVDGGLRNVSPLGDVIKVLDEMADNEPDERPNEIVMINCSPEKMNADEEAAKNVIQIAKRSLTEISINEIFRSDIEEFISINYILEQVPKDIKIKKPNKDKETYYKYFRYVLIEPDYDPGDSLDFETKVKENIDKGYKTAEQRFNEFYSI